MWDTENPDQLAKFAITAGQAVYIRTEVDEDGKIGIAAGDAVSIVVDADEETSTHYIPKVDNETSSGVAGHYLYKLAVLKEPIYPATTPTLEKWLTGSHLDHYAELPSILSTLVATDGVGVIPQKWDDAARAYKLRALSKGFGQNTITTNTDEVEIRGTKKDGGVKIWYGDLEPSEPEIEWADGYLQTGAEVIGDEAEPPEPLVVDVKIPEVVPWADDDAQIQVNNIAALGGTKYEIRGNAKDGSLTYTVGGGSPVTVLEWIDGLIVTEDVQNIPLPEVPEMELVELEICVEGEMYTREFYCKPIPPP
jgi:hypothetical protein